MFRGRDNGGLPMTGQRTAAPHISTVQLPQVSTPTLLTYVWLGASILVFILGIVFSAHSPDHRRERERRRAAAPPPGPLSARARARRSRRRAL